VVPAPARARYTDHLADCAACRSAVVDLSQAAGMAAHYKASEPARGAAFWQTVTTLFSPRVLGFAVPALVLTAVIGIGLLVLRQQRQTEYVARNETVNTNTSPQQDAGAVRPGTTEPQTKVENGAQTNTNAETSKDKSNFKLERGEVAGLDRPTPEPAKAAPAKDAAGAGAGLGTVADSRSPYAFEPKAAAPPPAPLAAAKPADVGTERRAKTEQQERERDEVVRNRDDDLHGPSRSMNNAPMSANQQVPLGVRSGRGPSALEKKKSAENETRTVVGIHFRREGNVWVDEEYESSWATIKVTRGSDQFRALVADEPGIRTIAEQLSGVVIVIWKNRAYRIQ
jgi:hypothetical protein